MEAQRSRCHPDTTASSDGGFGPNGTFCSLPIVSLSGLEQLFRHRVLKMMLRTGLITSQRVKLLLSWKHSGFNVDGSVVS